MSEASVTLRFPLSDDDFGDASERDRLSALEGELSDAVERAGAGAWTGHEWGGGAFEVSFAGPDVDALLRALGDAGVDVPAGVVAVIFRTDDEDETPEERPFPGPIRKGRKPKKAPADPVAGLAELVGVAPETLSTLGPGELWSRFFRAGVSSMGKAERSMVVLGGLLDEDRGAALMLLACLPVPPPEPDPLRVALDARDEEGFVRAIERGRGGAIARVADEFGRRTFARFVALGA